MRPMVCPAHAAMLVVVVGLSGPAARLTDASVNQRRGTEHESHTSPADCDLRLLRLRLRLRPRLRSKPSNCVRLVTNLPSGGGLSDSRLAFLPAARTQAPEL